VVDLRSVGVEEELLLVEPDTGRPRALAGTILHAARQAESGPGGAPGAAAPDAAQALESEMQLQQLESNTQPC
jgi:glutamate---cysteine ligase / carboxylate-amine ligase